MTLAARSVRTEIDDGGIGPRIVRPPYSWQWRRCPNRSISCDPTIITYAKRSEVKYKVDFSF